MNNIWATSDTHFWHEAVLKFCPETREGRDGVEMTELMIERWNKDIKPSDTVYHAGDFSFGGVEKIRNVKSRLNGQIHLCLGNHCKMIKKKKELTEMFTSVQYRKHVRIGDNHFIIHHEPIAEWENAHKGWYHLFGHQHGSGVNINHRFRCMDIGVDTRKDRLMVPYHIDEILFAMKDKEILPHHGQIG